MYGRGALLLLPLAYETRAGKTGGRGIPIKSAGTVIASGAVQIHQGQRQNIGSASNIVRHFVELRRHRAFNARLWIFIILDGKYGKIDIWSFSWKLRTPQNIVGTGQIFPCCWIFRCGADYYCISPQTCGTAVIGCKHGMPGTPKRKWATAAAKTDDGQSWDKGRSSRRIRALRFGREEFATTEDKDMYGQELTWGHFYVASGGQSI